MKKRRPKQTSVKFNRQMAYTSYHLSEINGNGDISNNNTSPSFHGFVPKDEKLQNSSTNRSLAKIVQNDFCESSIHPSDTEHLFQNSLKFNRNEHNDYKDKSEIENDNKCGRYRQISESSSNTSIFSSPKSPIKMVFKKQSGSMTVVSPTFTSELSTSSKRKAKNVKRIPYDESKFNMDSNHVSPQPKSLVIEKKKPLRPIEAQTVINIGGYKYLVVPKVLETFTKIESTKLPFLLRPIDDLKSNLKPPTFELEETSSGQLILVPLDSESLSDIPDCMKRNVNQKAQRIMESMKETKIDLENFMGNLSNGYHAVLLVFRYLSPQDCAKCRRVCKLWKDIAEHPSLWTKISLKDCYINNWSSFGQIINRQHTRSLSMRGMLHVKPNNEKQSNSNKINWHSKTWIEFSKSVDYIKSLETLEFPRIRISDLQKVMTELSQVSKSELTEIIATSIVTSPDVDNANTQKSFNLDTFAQVNKLKTLRIKAASGNIHVLNLASGLESLASNVHTTLTKLSLLSLGSSIRPDHLDIIARLTNLESLEIGDCTITPDTPSLQPTIPLSKLSTLNKLVHLRIEGGKVGRNIGSFEKVDGIKSLELINTELELEFSEGLTRLRNVNSFLLIPLYKSDTATINAEIMDSILSMEELKLFIFGFTNEWLKSLSISLGSQIQENDGMAKKNNDVFPIMINGCCEIFSLKKLYKTLKSALTTTELKILKMPKSATYKQSVIKQK